MPAADFISTVAHLTAFAQDVPPIGWDAAITNLYKLYTIFLNDDLFILIKGADSFFKALFAHT